MFQKIVVPLDGSELAERAVPIAARIARSTGASLILVRVVYPPIRYDSYTYMLIKPEEFYSEVAEEEVEVARNYLRRVAMSEPLAGIEVEIHTVASPIVAEAILETTQKTQSNLIILCSHGYTGLKRWALGNVAQKLTRHSTIPVLVLREKSDGHEQLYTTNPQTVHVLIALDGSPLSETAIEPAIHLGVALSVPEHIVVNLIQVLALQEITGIMKIYEASAAARERFIAETQAYLEEIKKKILIDNPTYRNLTVTTEVLVHDDVAGALVEREHHINAGPQTPNAAECFDMMALTTHGRSGLQRWALGSIAERVLNATKLPLLIVHPDSKQV